jgi:RNA polymerase sigma factor (sigma-70 family)
LVTSSTSRSAALDDPDLAAALGGLAPRQRQIVALRYWDDLTLRDCADAMGVSLGTAKQHLARAHRHLAATLDPSMLEELTL